MFIKQMVLLQLSKTIWLKKRHVLKVYERTLLADVRMVGGENIFHPCSLHISSVLLTYFIRAPSSLSLICFHYLDNFMIEKSSAECDIRWYQNQLSMPLN